MRATLTFHLFTTALLIYKIPMIRSDEVFKIGYITRHRGLRGEVEMSFTDDCFDTGSSPYLVFGMDDILVPFFWEEYRFKNDNTLILKLEEVDDEQHARYLVGHNVYYPKAHLASVSDNEAASLSSYKALTGFSVTDVSGRNLGHVAAVDDSSANILLTLESPSGEEVLIPFHDDFLVDFDLRERTFCLDLPEGILSLNS